jgi:Xaa-Pro aminopeptidase
LVEEETAMSGTDRPEPLYNAVELLRMYDELGLDAVIARSGRNVAYLAGMRFPGTLGRLQDFAHAPRAVLAVMPRDGDGALVASNIAAGLARRTTWLDDIRTYVEYSESPFTVAAGVLADRGLAKGRIGVERREIGVQQWDDLVAALPDAELIDCTDALEGVRNIKTPAELDLLRNAVRIQDEAHLEVFGSARAGETERALHARMIGAMLRLGAESAHGMLQSSRTPMTYGGEGDVPIEPGDAIRTDYVCYVEGYAANLSRMAVMGAPSAEQERMYALVRDVHRETIATMLRPGVAARDVYSFVRDRFVAAGHPKVSGLVGHSIGVWWHQEEPMLVPSEARLLRPNMVVCLEPILDGFWHLQDEILITDDEPALLSDLFDTDRIFTIDA